VQKRLDKTGLELGVSQPGCVGLRAQHNPLLRHPAHQPARSSSHSLDPAENEKHHKKKIPHTRTKLFPQANKAQQMHAAAPHQQDSQSSLQPWTGGVLKTPVSAQYITAKTD
jgi:hypothetical protein